MTLPVSPPPETSFAARGLLARAARGLLRRLVADGLPPAVRRALRLQLALAHASQQPALVAAPAGRRVLVLAPHADDESLGCGGTLALAAQAGCSVRVLVLTDGRKGYDPAKLPPGDDAARERFESVLAAQRLQEAAAACRCLGLPAPGCLGMPDGALASAIGWALDPLAELLADWQPELIFSPFATDAHPDHRAAARLLARALARVKLPAGAQVWAYETRTPLPANTFVDIGSSIVAKRAAIAAHASQMAGTDLLRVFDGLAAYRSLGAGRPGGAVEAFHRDTPAGYIDQVRRASAG